MRRWGRGLLLAMPVVIAVTGTVAVAKAGGAGQHPPAPAVPLRVTETLSPPTTSVPSTTVTVPPTAAVQRAVHRAASAATALRVQRVAPVAAVPSPPQPPWYELRGEAVLARITYPRQTLGFSITFLGPRPGLFGKTMPAAHRIEVYVRPDEDDGLLLHMIAHELGHAVDVSYNDDARRSRWLQQRGIDPSTPWFGCNLCTDYQTPAGDFAETFAFWQAGPRDYRSRMAPAPTPDQLQALLPLFSA